MFVQAVIRCRRLFGGKTQETGSMNYIMSKYMGWGTLFKLWQRASIRQSVVGRSLKKNLEDSNLRFKDIYVTDFCMPFGLMYLMINMTEFFLNNHQCNLSLTAKAYK